MSMLSGASKRRRRSAARPPKIEAAPEARHLRREPCRLRRVYVLLACCLGVVVALTAVQQALIWTASPNPCAEKTDEDQYCSATSSMIVLLVVGKQMFCMVLVFPLLFFRTFDILRYRRHLRRALEGSTGTKPALADHWTAVASKDTFRETARTVSRAQLIVFVTIGSSTGVATASQIHNALTRATTLAMQGWVTRACCAECQPFDAGCPCDVLCSVSYGSLESFLTLNVGLVACLIASVIFIPLPIWSPVADAAFTRARLPSQHHFTVLKRVRALPVPLSILVAITIAVVTVYAVNFLAPTMLTGVAFWRCVLVANAFASLSLLALMVWSAGVRRLLTLPFYLLRTCASALHALVSRCVGRGKEQTSGRGLKTISRLWRCHSSWRYRQLVLLCACLYCFVIEALNLASEGVSLLYIGRGVTLLLLLVTRDAEAQPEVLATEGAGFGLLVPASRLTAALRAHLAGKPYRGRMPRYKATVLRMEETLAVSYRWHDEQRVPLGEGNLELNINRWQAASLLAAIKAAGCRYVWMDNLAIPHDVPGVQRTLLSRMMAVYSSALVTLVLRSAEHGGCRYHQRVWTLQEYCSARALIMLTEEEEEGEGAGEEEGLAAVMDGEEEVIEALRLEHMARLAECQPVWLTEGGPTAIMQSISASDAAAIWATYQTLSTGLHCRYRADVVRALYPLLWNRPAESEAELVALLHALQEVHGIPQDGLVRMLWDSSSRTFKEVPVVAEEEEEEEEESGVGIQAALRSGFSVRSLVAPTPPALPIVAWTSQILPTE
eukprot:jgi/Tetstr1/446881/TSEL_003661.t1